LRTPGLAFGQSLLFRLPDSHLFLGVKQSYIKADIEPGNLNAIVDGVPDWVPDEIADPLRDWLRNNLTVETANSALGLVMAYDNRDNIFTPRKGYDYRLEYNVYHENFGGDFNYESVKFEGLNYWPLRNNLNFALRLASEVILESDQRLPFYALPGINMRGIPAARYQGEAVALAEAQLTWDVNFRWAVSIFGGAGRAADSPGELSDAASRTTKGVGFRYQIAKRYGFYSGVDIARGPEETAFYIKAGASW
ncbi:MAG: BamA/TamA family outer membrane protein, partial [Pseudomonadales bacterium]|nr:BamA/TamA family outer membrane protein [Pseudomonadales bacterium]